MTRFLTLGFVLLPAVAPAEDATVLRGDDLRLRGAFDLRTALAGVGGVEVSPGGDLGPAGSMPAFRGLRGFDAFLLVVDGVPAGGAFAPALATLDLTNVERIEVTRGVIHVIHYPAGQAEQRAWAGGGAWGTVSGGGAAVLGDRGSWKQSLAANIERRGFADAAAGIGRGHLLYRAAGTLGTGSAHLDLDVTWLEQSPDSPVVREGTSLTTRTPLDANHNPSDAELAEKRVQVNGGYRTHSEWGEWASLASLAITRADALRGFLEDPGNPGPNADGYEQERTVADLYLDSHFELPVNGLELAYGADALIGMASQESRIFEYTVSLDGSNRPSSASAATVGQGDDEDQRNFLGAYLKAGWHARERLDVLAGLRLNFTHERRESSPGEDLDSNTRLSGTLGARWRFLEGEAGHASLYADYRNGFKPAAFGPGPGTLAAIPRPRTAQGYEVGVRSLIGERLEAHVAGFHEGLENVLLEGDSVRRARLRGAEVKLGLRVSDELKLSGSYARHDARFVDATINNGADDVGGNRLELAPDRLASFAFFYLPPEGVYYGASWNSIGDRFLDKLNTARAAGYRTVDATLGYREGALTLALHGYNLTDRREPVAASEASEVVAGASSYYRMSPRHVEFMLGYSFGSGA